MSLTPSTMLPLGTPAPDFNLPDPTGRNVSMSDFKDKTALLVMFICNHCPYVKHINRELSQLGRDYQNRSVGMVAINANDIERYPEDAPDKMAREIASMGYVFPYVLDETQKIAQAFQAACTPEFYLFDRSRKLVYRGQFDDSRPGNSVSVTGRDLRAALEAVLAGRPVSASQSPGIGCNIKWKPGHEPRYFQR
jgi:peroxiredoxin